MQVEEIWKDIPSVPQLEASSYGRIRIKPYSYVMHNGGVRNYNPSPRVGSFAKGASGRKDAPKRRMIFIKRLGKTFNVARLVCEAFHGPAPIDKPIVMHLDEDPSNNSKENLSWGTQKENLSMPKAQAAFRSRTGENSPRAIWKKRRAEK